MEAPSRSSWLLLGLGVLAASISAILIRYARDADPLAISLWRCAAGAAVLAPFAGRDLSKTPRRAIRTSTLAGIFLAVHFATWITSLGLTSVAASVLLVSTSPVFVAIASWWLFKDRLPMAAWVGIVATMVGSVLIAGGDLSGTSRDGNILAIIGGITGGAYILAGQVARRDTGILGYATVTYTVAAVPLLVVCLVRHIPLWGYDAGTWIAIVALIAVPQLLGHTVINLVLKDIDATTVTVAIMAEPVIATILAFVLFSEVPTSLVYPGGAAILLGIYLVSARGRPQAVVVE
ncbi:MAG TPA: DMT family transporter [Actinomycetota bacterium]|nr:DMT family transporter [Actinomycetota bacterium]